MPRDHFFRPPPPAPQPVGFMLFPMGTFGPQSPTQEAAQLALYQWAWAKAQAVVAPSLLERDLLGVWN